jgi:hypothetical protein
MDDILTKVDLIIDKDKLQEFETRYRPFDKVPVDHKYVAFLDVLGFSNMVTNKFEQTLEIYEKLIDAMRMHEIVDTGVSLQIYSDSILLVSDNLASILQAAGLVQFTTLFEGFLVRGGIGYGKHVSVQNGAHTYVVSEALINAVNVEKTVKMPCVALHEDINIPDEWWPLKVDPVMRILHYFKGLNVVSPLNMMWGVSAIDRVKHMKEQAPEFSEKYDYFIELATSILERKQLVPEHLLP